MYLQLFCFLAMLALVAAHIKEFTWTLTWDNDVTVDPSLLTKRMIVINGTWPPPTTVVNLGDEIHLTVINNLDVETSTTLHAHGFHQLNNNPYDGPEGITQCGIKYQQSFQYIWHADKEGTFWIHSHHVGQYPYGLRAPLIVKIENSPSEATTFNYDPAKDFTIGLSEWFNLPQDSVDEWYRDGVCGKGLEYPPQGLIMNEKVTSKINAGSATSGRMRLRFINMSAFATIIIYFSGQVNFRVMEIDSVTMDKDYMSFGQAIELNAGQRISIIIDPAQNNFQNFNIYSTIDESHFGGNVCAALNPHQGFRAVTYVKYTNQPNRAPLDTYDVSKAQANGADSAYDPTYLWVARNQTTVNLPTWAEKFKSDSTVVTDNWYFDRLRPATAIPRILHQGNEKIIYLSLTATEGNTAFANLNSNTFNTTTVPVLLQAIRPTNQNCPAGKTPTYANINSDLAFFGTNNTFTLTQGENVIMVITSYVGSHTFHLHGHDFQVLYHQPEAPTPQAVPDQPDDTKLRNNGYNMPAYPLRRDTLFITRKTYSIIAFKANNPGAWFFHCHNDFHAMSGMAGAFVTGPDLTGKGAPGVWGDTVYNQCRAPGNQGSITGFWRDCLP